MTRFRAARVRADFLLALATEVESHLSNGSEYVFSDDAPPEENAMRVRILKSVVNQLRRRARRVTL